MTIAAQKILLTLSVLIASHATSAQYSTYEQSDEEDDGDDKPRVDYSRYFGGQGPVAAPGVQATTADVPGFVQPLDFTGFFAGAQFGLDGLAGGASQHIYNTRAGSGVTLPFNSGVFPPSDPVTSNTSGFVNDVKFPSLFDSSSSSSDNGFRPRDFLQQGSHPESTSPSAIYSPTFASLQRDVDREVDYQRAEEDKIDHSRAASRRVPEYDTEDEDEDEGEFDSFEFDDGPDTEYRIQKHNNKSILNEKDESHTNPIRKESFRTPYGQVNQIKPRHPRPRPVNSAYRRPAQTVSEDGGYAPPVKYRSGHYDGIPKPSYNPQPTVGSNKHNIPYIRTNSPPLQKYNPSPNNRQLSYPQPPRYEAAYQRPITNEHSYYPAQSRHASIPARTHSSRSNNPATYFRPSPRDPYIAHSNQSPSERRVISSKPKINREGINSLPQTDYATVVELKHTDPSSLASENKKECKITNKNLDPNEFARFKRHQMTCYICTNKEKGNKYEECSYESKPKADSFRRKSAEAYSSDTVIPETYRIRQKRSTLWNQNYGRQHKQPRATRNERDQEYEYDSEEQGHGPEHYRFGPEHFQSDEEERNVKGKNPSQRTDYDEEYEDESEDETDVEKEYEPPGAGENDNCHRVNRNGLICMVCQKPNSRGTYEQCSYASDPDANRYEYAKSSSYGSKRPQSHRDKRYSLKESNDRFKPKRYSPYKPHHGPNKNNPYRRGDFRNGKLKRKKVIKGDARRPLYHNAEDKNYTDVSNEDETRIVGLDPFFYGSSETYNPDDYDERGKKIKRRDGNDGESAASSTEEDDEDVVPTYEDSFYKLFPELVGMDPYTGESNDKEEKATKKTDDYDHPRIPYVEVEDEEESESIQNNRKVKPGFEYGVELPDYYFNEDDTSKKDLEKTLDEFTQKNRSDCKKVIKDKMTCYQCINKNGLQHEECMFVAASEPKSKHLAYHEVKEFRIIPTEKTSNDSTLDNSENIHTDKYPRNMTPNANLEHHQGHDPGTKKYKYPKKVRKTDTDEMLEKRNSQVENEHVIEKESSSGEIPSVIMTHDILKTRPKEVRDHYNTEVVEHYNGGLKNERQRQKRNPQKDLVPSANRKKFEKENSREEVGTKGASEPRPVKANYNAVPPEPEGFDEREGPEGAYSHETEPVYDSVLKMTLPKYMLSRSEHEDIFDEVLRSG